jgi:outer membrane protein
LRLHSLLARAGACALAAALLAPAGCATVRRARSVQDASSAVPGERTPTAAELGLATAGPVRLVPLVEAALRAHPSVVAARRAAEAARARVLAAEGARLPEVSASAAASWRDGSRTGGRAVEHRFASYGFDVSWLLFDFGEQAALTRAAASDWLAAQADLRTAEVNVAFGVRQAYFNLAKNVELLQTARETVAQYQAHLDQVTELERVGKRIPYDVTKARVDLGNARLAEVLATDAIEVSRAALVSAVGLAEVTSWLPDAEEPPVPQGVEPSDFRAAWKATLPRRPSLAAAAARERAACSIVDARVAALYPSLSLGASWGESGSSLPLPWSFDLGPIVRWTPFDGFRNLASIDESVALLRAARADRAAEEQRAWLEVRQSWVAIEDATKRLDLADLQVQSATDNLTLAQGRFDAGLGTSVDLSDARQSLVAAEAEQIRARADHSIAVASLVQAVGFVASRESP